MDPIEDHEKTLMSVSIVVTITIFSIDSSSGGVYPTLWNRDAHFKILNN